MTAELVKVITDAQDILARYIVPDSGISEHECVNQLLGLLDGPQTRKALAPSSAPSSEAVATPTVTEMNILAQELFLQREDWIIAVMDELEALRKGVPTTRLPGQDPLRDLRLSTGTREQLECAKNSVEKLRSSAAPAAALTGDTPRTDAAIERGECGPDHARQLERELSASHRRAEAFKEAMHSYEQAARVERDARVSVGTPDTEWAHSSPCCGQYAECVRACTPRGEWIAEQRAARLTGGNSEQVPHVRTDRVPPSALSSARLAIPEKVRATLLSQDLYQVLLDVQNGINSPALKGMANGAIRKLDKARAALYAAESFAAPAGTVKPSERLRDALHNMGTHSPALLEVLGEHLSTAQAEKVLEEARRHQMNHGDTSPCIDKEEQELCEWAFNGGDPDTGVEWCWTCKTCGCVDINRDPPSDPDADAYERNL